MIKKLKFNKNKSKSFGYVLNLPSMEFLNNEIEFKSGLNIIVGPVGSGKSSILKAISSVLAASEMGESILSESYLFDLDWSDDNKVKTNIELEHDGTPIIYADPKRSSGLLNSGAINDEFYQRGFFEKINMSAESSGERSQRRMEYVFDVISGKEDFPKGFQTVLSDHLNSLWKERTNYIIKNFFSGNCEKGQKTILMDEPESGLGMIDQVLLWNNILKSRKTVEKYQIILVSHSSECLNIEHANYIELKEGYIDACNDLLNKKITYEEAKNFSENRKNSLSKKELKLLKKINDLNGDFSSEYNVNDSDLDRLFELELIQDFRKKRTRDRKQDIKGFMKSISNDFNVFNYRITKKGMEYL